MLLNASERNKELLNGAKNQLTPTFGHVLDLWGTRVSWDKEELWSPEANCTQHFES